jgi:hypothetical protein
MSQRVNVGLISDTNAKPIKTALKVAGATSVHGPAPELPDVLVVTIPNHLDINEFINDAQKLPGVRYAEPDSWQFTA